MGLIRYADRGPFADRRPLGQSVAPMGAGSVVGAVAGEPLVGLVPVPALKLGLGLILIVSAARMFRHAWPA